MWTLPVQESPQMVPDSLTAPPTVFGQTQPEEPSRRRLLLPAPRRRLCLGVSPAPVTVESALTAFSLYEWRVCPVSIAL